MKVKILNRAISKKSVQRIRRKLRIRNKISGTGAYPRMSFYRSNKNLSVQVIDDTNGKTIMSISTYEKAFKTLPPTIESAKTLAGECIKRLKAKNVEKVVFDRNGYKFHGILKAFVESINESGIKI